MRNITNRIADVLFSLARVQVAFGGINERNVGTLKSLNGTILPVRYSNKVYDEILTTPKEFTKFGVVAYSAHCLLLLYPCRASAVHYIFPAGYYKSLVLGAICARLEEKTKGTVKLYIMTLGTLPAYRGHGVGL